MTKNVSQCTIAIHLRGLISTSLDFYSFRQIESGILLKAESTTPNKSKTRGFSWAGCKPISARTSKHLCSPVLAHVFSPCTSSQAAAWSN